MTPHDPATKPPATEEGRVHKLKTWPAYFAEVRDGIKTFEVRLNDRGFQVGDTLILCEWSLEGGYTGAKLTREISYFIDGFPGIERGHCVLGLREPAPPTPTQEGSEEAGRIRPKGLRNGQATDSYEIEGVWRCGRCDKALNPCRECGVTGEPSCGSSDHYRTFGVDGNYLRAPAPSPTPLDEQTRAESAQVTEHDEFMRCMDCGNATVGLSRPYSINHKPGCSAWRFSDCDPTPTTGEAQDDV